VDASLHDAYAAGYDRQVQEYGSHVHEALFGLCYDFIHPGQRLLDLGIGTGLAAELFARAGLIVYGLDFSPAMLALCRSKGFAVELICQDAAQPPWRIPDHACEHVTSCGVFHFIGELDAIFYDAHRVLSNGGIFAFTTRVPPTALDATALYDQRMLGGMDIFSHAPGYVIRLLDRAGFALLKRMRCFVSEDDFYIWVARKAHQTPSFTSDPSG
jgi:predicted TPR repeat methyltransferase